MSLFMFIIMPEVVSDVDFIADKVCEEYRAGIRDDAVPSSTSGIMRRAHMLDCEHLRAMDSGVGTP